MRVIGGQYRSRRIQGIPGMATRPTPDRLRESLFDILAPRIEGAVFMDVYAGTGSVGIEAISRGARHAFFLERSRSAVTVLRENLASLGIERQTTVVCGPALKAIAGYTADVVFLDPPYDHEREYRAALELLGGTAPPLVIVQHSTRLELEEQYGSLRRTRWVKQGDNALSFYTPELT
jgi:16S rRNA (guanine(966)-N(2))-methyltransferase RsmD